jgi:hypothetical protein
MGVKWVCVHDSLDGTFLYGFVGSGAYTGLLDSSLSVGLLAVTMRVCWCIPLRCCGVIEWHRGFAPSSVGYELAYLVSPGVFTLLHFIAE